jgi:hypothetical protein
MYPTCLVTCLLLLAMATQAAEPPSPLENYRRLEFPPKEANFDQGWEDRVMADYCVINSADLHDLRTALKDGDPFVRAIAAYALGVRGDEASSDALVELITNDKEPLVRIRAVEALALLKMRPDVIESARKDRDPGVQFVAKLVIGQVSSEIDYATQIRQAYAKGIDRRSIGSAVVGKPAPDFTALNIDGRPFQLSSLIGKNLSQSTSPPSTGEADECTNRRSCASRSKPSNKSAPRRLWWWRWTLIEPESLRSRTGCSVVATGHSRTRRAWSTLNLWPIQPAVLPQSTESLAARCGGGAGWRIIRTGL